MNSNKEPLETNHIETVYYDPVSDLIVIKLKNEGFFAFPPKLIASLENHTRKELSDVWLSNNGTSIYWENLDIKLSIVNLVTEIFGIKSWMSELGKKGGQATSEAKKISSRENGKKGGRPRKKLSNI